MIARMLGVIGVLGWAVLAHAQATPPMVRLTFDAPVETIHFDIEAGGKTVTMVRFAYTPEVTIECPSHEVTPLSRSQSKEDMSGVCIPPEPPPGQKGHLAYIEAQSGAMFEILQTSMRTGNPLHVVIEMVMGGYPFVRQLVISRVND